MKKLFKLIITVICVSLYLPIMAQHDPAAKAILEKVTKKTKNYTSIKAEFTNTLINETEDISESFEGTIYIKGNKYKLIFMDTETYFNGTTKWVYIKESEEVNVANIDTTEQNDDEDNSDSQILSNPIKIFELYKNGFKYMYIGEKKVDNKRVDIIDLIPEDLNKSYFRIRLFIDKLTENLYLVKYFSKDGNNYTLKINSFEVNSNIDESFFVFNTKEHPNVDVIDLRD